MERKGAALRPSWTRGHTGHFNSVNGTFGKRLITAAEAYGDSESVLRVLLRGMAKAAGSSHGAQSVPLFTESAFTERLLCHRPWSSGGGTEEYKARNPRAPEACVLAGEKKTTINIPFTLLYFVHSEMETRPWRRTGKEARGNEVEHRVAGEDLTGEDIRAGA